MLKAFKERHDYVVQRLQAMPGIECAPSDGTFYSFPKVQGLIDAIGDVSNDVDMAEHLIEHAGVALVPGSAFGTPGHARLSIATGMDNLKTALDRLEAVLL